MPRANFDSDNEHEASRRSACVELLKFGKRYEEWAEECDNWKAVLIHISNCTVMIGDDEHFPASMLRLLFDDNPDDIAHVDACINRWGE
jgi:hypothetical protein